MKGTEVQTLSAACLTADYDQFSGRSRGNSLLPNEMGVVLGVVKIIRTPLRDLPISSLLAEDSINIAAG